MNKKLNIIYASMFGNAEDVANELNEDQKLKFNKSLQLTNNSISKVG